MITLIILLTVLLALVIGAIYALLAFGAGIIVVFGDLIIFGLIVWLIIRLFRRRK